MGEKWFEEELNNSLKFLKNRPIKERKKCQVINFFQLFKISNYNSYI